MCNREAPILSTPKHPKGSMVCGPGLPRISPTLLTSGSSFLPLSFLLQTYTFSPNQAQVNTSSYHLQEACHDYSKPPIRLNHMKTTILVDSRKGLILVTSYGQTYFLAHPALFWTLKCCQPGGTLHTNNFRLVLFSFCLMCRSCFKLVFSAYWLMFYSFWFWRLLKMKWP